MGSDDPKRSIFEELKRRHVWRVATLYAAGAFIVWQVADIAFPALGLPETAMTWLVVLAIAGFPIAVGLAWVFQLTSVGVKRTSQLDALDPVEGARVVRPPSPAGRVAFVTTLTAAVLLGTWAIADRMGLLEGEPEISHTALAVLPFNVLGPESLNYLREGMVDLLSRGLDGVGDLKAVDPVRVTKVASVDQDLDEDGAVDVARRIGAGQYVTGSIAEAAGRLRISASLYSLQDSVIALSKGDVEGDTTELFSLIDRLTGQLLAGRSVGAASEVVVRSAALNTTSLPALKAFLEGETLFRKARFPAAAAAFSRAVENDSSFATAYYRLGVANGFGGRYVIARQWLERALELADSMSDHDRRMATAYQAIMKGDLRSGVGQYRRIVMDYPEDLEAKVHAGRALMDLSFLEGEPLDNARELLTGVLEVDPDYECALCDLQYLARRDRDWDALERYMKIKEAKDNDGDSTLYLTEKLFLARAREQAAEVERLLLVADTVTDRDMLHALHDVGHSVQLYFGDVRLRKILLEAYEEQYEEYPEFWHAYEWQSPERSEGHMTKFLDYVRQLSHVEFGDHPPVFQIQMETLLHFDPDLEIPRDQLEEALDDLRKLPSDGVLHINAGNERELSDALYEPLQWYYIGLIHSRLGSLADAESRAAALDGMVTERPDYAGLYERWARTIRADVAYRQGDWDRVVELVDRRAPPVVPELERLLVTDEAFARVLQTDALLALDRPREALRWLNYGLYNRVDASQWVAFKSERSAHAHDALREVDEAIANYQRFIDTWIDADPELQPRVDAARKRLSELVSARG